MHVISTKALRSFWERHPDAEEPLQEYDRADWKEE